MGTSLVVTVIGNDRPGIVERLSDVVLAAEANWKRAGWRGWPASSQGFPDQRCCRERRFVGFGAPRPDQ